MVDSNDNCEKKKELNQQMYNLSTAISDEIIAKYGVCDARYEPEIVSRETLLNLADILMQHDELDNNMDSVGPLSETVSNLVLKHYGKELARVIECRLAERKEELRDLKHEIQGII